MDNDSLINYLVDTIQVARPGYDKNTIINLFVCLSQGFLTVLSGAPGCGKTSICNIVSEVLGLNKFEDVMEAGDGMSNTTRYIPVSVERGWTSKRDFIGYYNPLTKAFEESNREVFDGLRMLNIEAQEGLNNFPFVILLDEANLSPIEYYWADFMNVCDDLERNNHINLGNNNIFTVPETLHFVATINNDHTTETLSPRVIDRAWIITLPQSNSMVYGKEISKDMIHVVPWQRLKDLFVVPKSMMPSFDNPSQKIYDELVAKLRNENIVISPRVDIAIRKYWYIASKLMEKDEFENEANIIAMDYAVCQKVLPKILGSGEDYEKWLQDLQDFCTKNRLHKSADILASMIERGNRQMKYFQFFC